MTPDPPPLPPPDPDDVAGGTPMDPLRPSGRMRLPTPARAATAAGILLAVSVLLLAGDMAVVQLAGDEAHVVPFFLQTEEFAVTGMRVTNAGSHDAIKAYEMFATSACGYAHRDVAVAIRSNNGTLPANWTADMDGFRVAGNVTFYVAESLHTPDLLRGRQVPTYREDTRDGAVADWNLTANTDGPPHPVIRIRLVHVNCQGDGTVTIERGPHPGTNVRFAFNSSEPWLSQLPVNQGVDFLYIAQRAQQVDNETFALLAENMQRGGEFWIYSMRDATVFDDAGIMPERTLRASAAVTLASAVVLLALALRRERRPMPPGPTDAAFALAAAGESHLLRLRRTTALVGALLIPMLAAATYVIFAVVPFSAPSPGWDQSIGAVVLVLDAAVIALWGLALRRAHQDLRAWRAAWTRMDAVDLDAL